jgi:tRNA(Ile)-lysidine synthase
VAARGPFAPLFPSCRHPMLYLHDRVWNTIRRHALLAPGARVVAAVSGGSDSVALLHLLHGMSGGKQRTSATGERDGVNDATSASGGRAGRTDEESSSGGRTGAADGFPPFTLAGVAHLNHLLRGADSDGDEQFCRDLAASLGLTFESARVDVAAMARDEQISVEVSAHNARYAFFRDAAARLRADAIALGHTKNDQAETYLLRLLRGAGSAGLAGMSPRRDLVIRPLLDISREELSAWLHDRGLPFREDASNLDVSIPRNRVRHELLPMLERRFTPAAVEVLARNAALARTDEAWMSQQADHAAASVVTEGPDLRRSLNIAALGALPSALALRVVRKALADTAGSRFCGLDQVDMVLAIASGTGERLSSADLPGVRVERIGPDVVLLSRGNRRGAQVDAWRYGLPVPGSLEIPEAHCEIRTRVDARTALLDGSGLQFGPDRAAIDADWAAGGLFVRSRQPGDSLRPLGLGGRKKVQDVLVDRKVPLEDRDRVALVVDSRDVILWIAGHLLAEDAKVTDRTQRVVLLELSRTGHLGDGA